MLEDDLALETSTSDSKINAIDQSQCGVRQIWGTVTSGLHKKIRVIKTK